ncbi:hypothetical protein BRC82_08160 [Halobacteriales archaeon QS_1_67_19]|nr:MAG: hypothetical protein BRC82_08160 [Halobacteriales archaeon QS_1_67_19]
MALLEVNLEKPALVEEYQSPGETAGDSTADATVDPSGGKGKLLGLLVLLAGIGAAGWKLKHRGTDGGDSATEGDESESESETEFDADESGGVARKIAGVVGAAVVLGLLVRKRRK